MNLTLSQVPPESATQLTIRIMTPWYRPLMVEAAPFGTYNVQFSATTDGEGTRVHIAAFPEATTKKPQAADRPICALSGSFETQPDAIAAWENGFVVVALSAAKPPHLVRAIIECLLKRRQAEPVDL